MLDLLQASPASFAAAAGVFGLLVGSFLNVVIYRLPEMMQREWQGQCAELLELPDRAPAKDETFNLVVPRSQCRDCGHQVSALQNIPVLSYLMLKGKCASCGSRISPRYPIIEALSGVMAVVVAWHFGFGWQAAGALLLTWALIALSFIDFDHKLLPDQITLPFMWLGLGLNVAAVYTSTRESVVGAMAGYLILWTVYQAFKLATGKEGMGYGDFKLMALMGAWMGWQALPVVILLSSLVGAVVGVTLILARGHGRNVPIPFGPYIAVAGWIALLWGEDITGAYLRFSGFA